MTFLNEQLEKSREEVIALTVSVQEARYYFLFLVVVIVVVVFTCCCCGCFCGCSVHSFHREKAIAQVAKSREELALVKMEAEEESEKVRILTEQLKRYIVNLVGWVLGV